METYILYLLKSGICLSLFYFIYVVFLDKETYFRINRFYLVSSVFISLLIPLLQFPANNETGVVFNYMLDTITVTTQQVTVTTAQRISSLQLLLLLYWIVVILLLVKFLLQLIHILWFIIKGSVEKTIDQNLVYSVDVNSAFSFLGYIFVNPSQKGNKDFHKVIMHEKIHIDQYHSLDIILLELLIIFQWFNPVVWFYKNAIHKTHEYLADQGVISKGFDVTEYQEILINHAMGIQYGLANNFNKSLTLNRLAMMNKIKSARSAKFKVLVSLPLIVFLLVIFACQKDANNSDNNSHIEQIAGDKVYEVVDVMPEYPGGENALLDYLRNNIKYPEAAIYTNATGKIYIQFVISKTGKISATKLLRSEVSADNEDIKKMFEEEAFRVIKGMPEWKPGLLKGEKVDVSFTIPIRFVLK